MNGMVMVGFFGACVGAIIGFVACAMLANARDTHCAYDEGHCGLRDRYSSKVYDGDVWHCFGFSVIYDGEDIVACISNGDHAQCFKEVYYPGGSLMNMDCDVEIMAIN